MFAPQHTARSVSPQRKRAANLGVQLGTEEAHSVGPQKLFADLKQTSATKASAGTSKKLPFGSRASPSRAFADKNSQSPLRQHHGAAGPSVPAKGARSSVPSKLEATQKEKSPALQRTQGQISVQTGKSKANQLVSPNKVTARVDAIFAGSVSPSKKKKSGKLTREAPNSPSKGSSSSRPLPSPQKTPQATLGTKPTQDSPSVRRQIQSAVTPAANVGNAGLARLRMGEMMDALHEQGATAEGQADEQAGGVAEDIPEEELYPEIEYMPPPVDIPAELPPALDGLPRGAEMGEMLANLQFGGTYRAASPATLEADRLQILAALPDKLDFEPESDIEGGREEQHDDDPWPDIEVRVATSAGKNYLAPRHASTRSPFQAPQGPSSESISNRDRKRVTCSVTSKPAVVSSATRPPLSRLPIPLGTKKGIASERMGPAKAITKPTETSVRNEAGKTAVPKNAAPRRPLLGDKSNTFRMASGKTPKSAGTPTLVKKTITNPALTDFENDALGKSLRAKWAALENEQDEIQGFAL